jgi:Mce-associated membrane protein
MPVATPPAAEPAPTEADESTADGGAPPDWEAAGQAEAARRRIWRIAAAAGSGVVAAALVGTLIWQSLAWHSASSSLAAGRAALPAAAAAAPPILSYQWTQVDKNLANADKYLTPRFRSSYDNSFTKAIKPFVVSNQLNLDSQVVNAGVIEASADRVVVLIFADQLSTSDKPQASGASTPSSLTQERAEFTMLKQHGTWLVDDITRLTVALPAGASPGNAASPSAGPSAAPSAAAAPAPSASPSPAAS